METSLTTNYLIVPAIILYGKGDSILYSDKLLYLNKHLIIKSFGLLFIISTIETLLPSCKSYKVIDTLSLAVIGYIQPYNVMILLSHANCDGGYAKKLL